METKQCNKCKKIKLIEDFYKDKVGKYGVRGDCKKCFIEHRKEYYKNNIEQKKEYYKNNLEKFKERNKEYNKNNLKIKK